MKHIVFSALLLAAALPAAEPPPDMPEAFRARAADVIAAAAEATPARYPDADSVVLDDRFHTRYEPDGSSLAWEDEWIKVLTEKGRRAHAAESLSFSARYGDAAFLCVEIIGTNGAVRAVDFARTLKTATDNAGLGSNIIDPLDKKISCTVSGLAVGEVRHLRVLRRTRKAILRDAWADRTSLEHTQPVLATTVTVDQPDARPLRHAVLRNALSNTVTRAADRPLAPGRTLLTWHATHVPQAFPEPSMPPAANCLQNLRLSTLDDWPTVSRWYHRLCAPHLAATSPAMTNAVRKLLKEAPDDTTRIRTLFRFVSQEIRYMGLTLEDDTPGFEPHDVSLTFSKRYGVCRDKAALLVALLRIAGLDAYPVLIHAGAKMDPDVPSPYFNHAIVAVRAAPNAAPLLMDPTNESTKDLLPAYLSDKSYLVASPAGDPLRTSPIAPSSANRLEIVSEGSLAEDDSALLTSRLRFAGITDTAFRPYLLRKTPEERRRAFEGFLRRVSPGAELLSLDITPADLRDTETPLALTAVARYPEIVLRGETRDALALPFLGVNTVFALPEHLLDEETALETRRFPLELSVTIATHETLVLTLGDTVGTLRDAPADIVLTNAPGLHFSRHVAVDENASVRTLRATRAYRLDDIHFTPSAYQALRTTCQEIEQDARKHPLFVRRADANADLHRILDRTVTHLVSPTRWTTTNTCVQKILTYRGKKNAAELRQSFAPSVQAPPFLAATVSNRPGRVHTLSPREINTLDGGWTAKAPRYPASKLVVANLPGVEIGSVLHITRAQTVTNAPVPFALNYVFGGTDPQDAEELEVHVPHGLDLTVDDVNFPTDGGTFTVTTNATECILRWTMRDVTRTSSEPLQPPARLFRPRVTLSTQDWGAYGQRLCTALAAARDGGSDTVYALGRRIAAEHPAPDARIQAIRRLLNRVRAAGPGLFELPFAQAFTPPDRVWAEGYGSHADRRNLLFALLEGAGFETSFLLAADDAGTFQESEGELRACPRIKNFSSLVVRAVFRTGWWPCRAEETFYLDGENEYTPPAATAHTGDTLFDPQADAFGRLASTPRDYRAHEDNFCRLTVRANGAVDFDVRNRTYGPAVGGLRKRFTELLPEMRSRFFQQLVGALAQNATATSELVTDTEAYPFELAFSAYAENYAVVSGDALTVRIPDFTGRIFGVADEATRVSPIALGAQDETRETYEFVFPRGYTVPEILPATLELRNPALPEEVWLRQRVTKTCTNDMLTVTVCRETCRPEATLLPSDYQAFLRDWNRRAAALSARTLSVRREQEARP